MDYVLHRPGVGALVIARVIARRSLSVLQWVLVAVVVLVILSLVVYVIGVNSGTTVPAPPLHS